MPFNVAGIQADGGAEFMVDFELACRDRSLDLFLLPPKRPQLNGAVELCNGHTSSTACMICPLKSKGSGHSPTHSPIDTITTGRTTPSKIIPRRVSTPSAHETPNRLICHEPGQTLYTDLY
jgi:hypothetical protein